MGFLLVAPIEVSYHFQLFGWLQKRFTRPGYDDKYRSRSYRFVERGNGLNLSTFNRNERVCDVSCEFGQTTSLKNLSEQFNSRL